MDSDQQISRSQQLNRIPFAILFCHLRMISAKFPFEMQKKDRSMGFCAWQAVIRGITISTGKHLYIIF